MTEQATTKAGASDVAETPAAVPRKRVIEYFWAKDALENSVSGFSGVGTASEETRQKLGVVRDAGRDEGIAVHLLFRQPGGYSILFVWAKPNYPLIRHSHDSDCMYYMVSGSVIAGDKTLRAGDGFFAPSDCLYMYTAGPEGAEMIEVRYGVEAVNTLVPPMPDKRVQADLELVRANVDRWKQMQISPTFAVNAQAQ